MSKPLYNSRIIDTYIKLIKRKYSYINIGDLLNYAGMKPYEVADQGHWFTQEQINFFHERLRKLTGNADIAREAGRYAASPEAIGVMRQYILGLVGPSKAYEMFGKASTKFTRSSRYESRKIDGDKIEVTATPFEDVREEPFQCANRTGFLEAASIIFKHEIPHIEHPECIFKGDKVCRYIINWKKNVSSTWFRARNIVVLLLSFTIVITLFVNVWSVVQILLPFSVVVVLLLTLIAELIEKNEMKTSLDNLWNSSDQLLEQINMNYNNALMANEVGQAISRQTNIDDILANVVQILEKRLDYDRGMILLTNRDKDKLVFRAGFGYNDEHFALLKKTSFHLNRPESRGAFVVALREQRPLLINDVNEIEGDLSPHSLAFVNKLGSQSFICCPIICEDEKLGILAVDHLKSKRPLLQSDMSLLMGIAPVIGISIRNADLIDARGRQFRSILKVMAASIDARDPLTAGHSEKVTEYAIGICSELGLSGEHREVIRVSALLHDYGKIGVPDAILKKNGILTDDEYEIVKAHSSKTREILEQVSFEGVFSMVPEIAGSHHEKIDGSGYPNGLKGKAIPLGARIIAVADFFEAITAKRHYRDPMTIEEAFHLLREGGGRHFDRRLVEALISYYNKTYACDTPQAVSWK
ncbi:MAG: phosphohydrolase [Geobacter sp.]|nr:MAG: phosphohydrolase [Geobacter sp.]